MEVFEEAIFVSLLCFVELVISRSCDLVSEDIEPLPIYVTTVIVV